MQVPVYNMQGEQVSEAELRDDIFAVPSQRGVDASGAGAPVGQRPAWDAQDQDAQRGPGWWSQAVAAEGHGSGPPGKHPGAAVARWWHGLWAAAAQL